MVGDGPDGRIGPDTPTGPDGRIGRGDAQTGSAQDRHGRIPRIGKTGGGHAQDDGTGGAKAWSARGWSAVRGTQTGSVRRRGEACGTQARSVGRRDQARNS